MAAELLRSRLPQPWTFGVTEDGRIFFINDESKSTTWLHPVYNHPIQSGHLSTHDLPKGWELAFTPEGIPYYVDHTNLRTSFIHPVTGESALPVHEDRQAADYYAYENKDFKRSSLRRSSKKQKVIDKVPVPKRSDHAPVTLKGWLYKQDSGGLKSWKKRWFVLSDFCLYYYKDYSETQLQGSILLPSYQIGFCNKSDGVNRKHSFKAEHQNMRTYYFAADNSDDQACWMNALKLASQLKNYPLEDNSQPLPADSYPQIEGHSPGSPPSQDCGDLNDSDQDRMLRSSANDPSWYNSQVNSSSQSHTSNSMYNQDQNSYQHDPRMRSGQDQQMMRNTYITHEPAYPDPRPEYSSNQQMRDRRPNPGIGSYGTQYQDSYRHGDMESLSSHGSRGIVSRDHNYNVPKGSYPVHSSQSNVPGIQQQDSNTLERSTDSVERTLDRSFDSVEVLPGYDSFAENHLQPASQYKQQPHATDGSVPVSRNSSLAEGQRQNSLLHLKQWTKNQQDKVHRQQQQHPDDQDHPPSDGMRKYGRDSTQSISFAGYSHRSPPDLRLNLETGVKQQEDGDQPARPPIPAEYREQYIRELAETKTPHTRSDLLTSIEIQRMKQQEPLVFQYPEVSPTSEHVSGASPPHTHSPAPETKQNPIPPSVQGSQPTWSVSPHPVRGTDPQNKQGPLTESNQNSPVSLDLGANKSVVQCQDRLDYEQNQGKENIQPRPGFSSEDVQSSQHPLDPSKSWDDLNDLDPDEAQFKYNSRIDLLLAEKRRIMGETSDILRNPNPDGSQTLHRGASAAERQSYNDYDQFSESQNHLAHDTLNEQMNSEYSKPIRRSLEPAFKGQKEANLYENMCTYSNTTVPPGDKPWPNEIYPNKSEQDYREQIPSDAAHSHQRLGDSITGQDGWTPAVSQSEHDVNYQRRPPVGQNLPWNSHPTSTENLSHSLGNLHVDVGEWPDSGVVPDRAASKPPWQKTEPLLGKMMPPTSTGNVPEEGHNGLHNGTPLDGQQPTFEFARRDIETIKEDPNMSDQDILTTKTLADLQRHLSGHRLRLSISAGDLIGKSHEELVLLLIQLRRDQSRLERARDYYRSKLDIHKPQEKDYKLKRKNSVGRLHEVAEREHDQYMELRKIYDELENQLEVSKPLVNLVDNMVRMGSLYGGNNLMLASQYKQHKLRPGEYTPPKKMIMFSRQYQEQKLTQLQEAELKQLMDDEVDLEEKLQQLYQLDRELQEKSLAVTNLQENKDLLENTVSQLRKELKVTSDPRTVQNIKFQLRHLEAELVKIRQQLAESSKLLEETSAEDARVENEVMLLRKKIYGMNRTQSTPSLTNDSIRAKQKLEQELEGVQNVMNNLSKQGAMLSDTIKALRHSTPDLTAAVNKSNNEKTYLETDIDTGRSRDLGKEVLHTDQEEKYGKSPYGEMRKEENIYASVKKFGRNNEWHVRDRSRSEPPTARRDNNWQGGIEATEVKTRIEPTRSQIQQQTVAPRDGSTYRMSNQRTSGYDSRQSGMGQEPGQLSPYRASSQQEGQSGLYRAEMKVVSAENLNHHGYQNTSLTSLGSQNQGSMDAVRQHSHHSVSQVGLEEVNNKVMGNGSNTNSTAVDVEVSEAKVQQTNVSQQLSMTSGLKGGGEGQMSKYASGDLESGGGGGGSVYVVSSSCTNSSQTVVTCDVESSHDKVEHLQDRSHTRVKHPSQTVSGETMNTEQQEKMNSRQKSVMKYVDKVETDRGVQSMTSKGEYIPKLYLPSDLALSLKASREEVIREALKQVSADTSDTNDFTAHTKQAVMGLDPVDDYLTLPNDKVNHPASDRSKTNPDDLAIASILPVACTNRPPSPAGSNGLQCTQTSSDHMRQQTYEQQTSNKPMSEVHPQQQQQAEQMAFSNQIYDASYSAMSSDSRVYEPIELSQADENTKKFFGILPKDAGKSQTVREVKKEAERRSRERKRFYVNVHGSVDLQQAEMMSQDLQRSGSLPHKTSAPSLLMPSTQSQDDSTLQRRKSVGVYRPKHQNKMERPVSATERLFPKQSHSGPTVNLNSRDSVRRISDIFSPRPFTPTTSTNSTSQSALKSFGSSLSRQGSSSATVATVRPVVSRREAGKSWSTENLSKDEANITEYWREKVKNRHTARGRFMTISSTEPIRMETGHGWKPSKHQSAAGDLISGRWHDVPDYIQSEPLKDLQIDSETIDREVLYVPEKVPIPERYVPDSDEEETEEDRERRLVKGEQIKRMLAAQSLAEWRHEEVGLGSYSGPIHKQVEAERKRREHILDLKQALAVQVTQRSKEVAGSSMSTQNYQPAHVSGTQKYNKLDHIQPGSRSYSGQYQLYSEDGYRGLYQ